MSRRESGYVEYPGGQIPVSVQYVPQSHIPASGPPAVSLRQSYGAPLYRDTSPYRNPVRSDEIDIQRIQEDLRFRSFDDYGTYLKHQGLIHCGQSAAKKR